MRRLPHEWLDHPHFSFSTLPSFTAVPPTYEFLNQPFVGAIIDSGGVTSPPNYDFSIQRYVFRSPQEPFPSFSHSVFPKEVFFYPLRLLLFQIAVHFPPGLHRPQETADHLAPQSAAPSRISNPIPATPNSSSSSLYNEEIRSLFV